MPTGNWPHSKNFFIPIVNRSKIGAKSIFDLFELLLHSGISDSKILEMYDFFHPLLLNFDAAHLGWSSQRSSSMANTQGVMEIIEQMATTKIRFWDNLVQIIYPIETTRYVSLFPHRRGPFQGGSVASRESALANFIEAIGDDTALATLKTDVVALQTTLNVAKAKQKNQMQSIELTLENLAKATLEAAEGMYYVHGNLQVKFYKNPTLMDIYFPIEKMEITTQTEFSFTLTNQTIRKALKHKFDITTQKIHGCNVGSGRVKMYFTNGLTNEIGNDDLYVIMLPNSIEDYEIEKMGYTDIKRTLYIVNLDSITQNVELSIE